MRLWIMFFTYMVSVASFSLQAGEDNFLRIPQPRSVDDTGYLYFSGLLQKVLQKCTKGRPAPELKHASMSFSTERKLYELRLNRHIDVLWLGGSKERAQGLRIVPIPLERGFLGYRQLIIHRKNVAAFDRIQSIKELSHFKACQESPWVDVAILRDAKLPVVTGISFENLFKQLVAGRCDYFPRGYNEAQIELAKRAAKYPDLTIYEPLILHYPFASYFFVHKNNESLAQCLEDGLEKMIDDGELLEYMKQHEHTRHSFPLKTGSAKRLLVIDNNYLPELSRPMSARYWFQLGDFVDSSEKSRNAR